MPSFKSKLLSGTMKSVKPIITGLRISEQRKGMNLLQYIHPKPKDVRIKEAEDCPLPGKWAIPQNRTPGKAVLYTHGGAYVYGSPSTHEVIISRLAEKSGVAVFAYDYRLAPEHPFPAALEDAVTAFDYLLQQGFGPRDIVLCGDSAGGGLTLALALLLRDRGRELPAALAVISPWTDLTESGDSHYRNAALDPLISSEELREDALLYAGKEELRNPYISPLYGDYTGFPPVLIHVGTNEVLLDDSRNLALEMDKQGVDVDIDIYEGMWHVWHMYDVPEARAAINKMVWFLQTALELDGMKKRTVRPGARYRHFKGKDYRVLYVARHSETLEEMVVYQQLYGDQGLWVRPLEMFLETVEHGGRLVYRFAELEEDT